MTAFLSEITSESKRYMILIKRPTMDWNNGQIQEPRVALTEDEVQDFSTLDPRLLRSRTTEFLVAYTDGGAARFNVTSRKWEILANNGQVRDRIRAAARILRGETRYRFTAPGIAWLGVAWPLALGLVSVLIGIANDPIARDYLQHPERYPAGYDIPIPSWLITLARPLLFAWPAILLVSLGLASLRVKSGGLRVWPESFNRKTMLQLLYRVRSARFVPASMGTIVVGVATAVLSSVFTFWLLGR